MSTVEETAIPLVQSNLLGVVRGRTIELERASDFPDGVRVAVELRPMVSQPAGPAWPDDVLAFAHAQGVAEYLTAVLEMTRRIFPSARRVDIQLDEDPEIANDRHIVFHVEAVGLDVPAAVAAEGRWCREIFHCCPATVVCVFRLDLETAD